MSSIVINVGNWMFFVTFLRLQGEMYLPIRLWDGYSNLDSGTLLDGSQLLRVPGPNRCKRALTEAKAL
jgi:hypothetical protein